MTDLSPEMIKAQRDHFIAILVLHHKNLDEIVEHEITTDKIPIWEWLGWDKYMYAKWVFDKNAVPTVQLDEGMGT